MNLDNQVPIIILHVLEADVAEDTGIVDEDVDAAESLDGSFDDCLTILDTAIVGNGLAASFFDLLNDHIGSLLQC
jgi:hypothetical protein